MPGEEKETRIVSGHATRKKDGWFRVDLVDDREMMVKEQALLNTKVYRIKKQDYFVSGTMKEKMNRKIKRRSKKIEEAKAHLRKQEAKQARENMLEDEIDLIAVQVEEGFFSKGLLWKLIKKQQFHSH